MSTTTAVNTIVIGAGQAGLAMSRWLQIHDVPHAVLERGDVGNSWRTQRWDSFCLNTPNLVNCLPGDTYESDEPLGFGTRDELISYFDGYAQRHELPIETGVDVSAVRRVGDDFEVVANGETRRCRNVVLCSGDQNAAQRPAISAQLPEDIVQLHTEDYRHPGQLPAGAVLVVGAGQSGCQIVEDLLEAGRRVYLCTSAVGRVPRRYRGKDMIEWFQLAGLADQTPADLEDPMAIYARQPQTSGTNGGHMVSLQQFARDGVILLGRLESIDERVLRVADDLEANVAAGDEFCTKIKGVLDKVIEKAGVDAPPAEPNPIEAPFDGIAAMAAVREVDLDAAEIRAVIFSTGFGPSFSYLEPDLLDERGRPRHTEGVCELPGLYCLGMLWLRRRVSGLITGVDGDAAYIASQILTRNGI